MSYISLTKENISFATEAISVLYVIDGTDPKEVSPLILVKPERTPKRIILDL